MLVFRADVLKKLMQDKDFQKELEQAKNMQEVAKVFLKYAEKHNLKVGVVNGWKKRKASIT